MITIVTEDLSSSFTQPNEKGNTNSFDKINETFIKSIPVTIKTTAAKVAGKTSLMPNVTCSTELFCLKHLRRVEASMLNVYIKVL